MSDYEVTLVNDNMYDSRSHRISAYDLGKNFMFGFMVQMRVSP